MNEMLLFVVLESQHADRARRAEEFRRTARPDRVPAGRTRFARLRRLTTPREA
jgi:hypothetical protein